MYKLYVIEDDRGIAEAVKSYAETWGFQVKLAEDFSNIMTEFAAFGPHAVIMDISLPFFNGYHWCAEIRRVSKLPIIFISSASDNMNIVMAMNMGADDFIAKPFDLDVLMAKLQAVLRRSYDFAASAPMLGHRGAFLDTGSSTLCYDGEKIGLTKNEYRILTCLLENKGRVVSREKLMERLWETESFVDDNALTVNVNRLRRKLDAAGLEDFIATRHGQGYIVE